MLVRTKSGHVLFEVASALQKAIRRGEEETAVWCAVELWNSGFGEYLWKRLRIITSEDVGLAAPAMPATIDALYRAYGDQAKKKDSKHAPERLFVIHAILALSRAAKSRLVDWVLIDAWTNHDLKFQLPDYAYDKHNQKGRSMGRGWDHFFTEGTILAPYADLEGEADAKAKARKAVDRQATLELPPKQGEVDEQESFI